MSQRGCSIVGILLLLLAVIVAALVIANRPKIGVEPNLQLSSIGSDRLEEGVASVLITSDSDGTFVVSTDVDGGLLFQDAEGINLSSDHRASITEVVLRADETRVLRFPYHIDPSTIMSGEYIVTAQVQKGGGGDRVLAEGKARAFVRAIGGGVEFLPSQGDFDALLAGTTDLKETQYRAGVILSGGDRPQDGILVVQVTSKDDGYTPTLDISVGVDGGIKFQGKDYISISDDGFSAQSFLRPIDEPGSRILLIPFRLNPDSLDGIYTLELSSLWNEKSKTDRLPIGIQVNSSALGGGDRWLALVEVK